MMLLRQKVLLFDMDGTIVDSLAFHQQALEDLFRVTYNIRLGPDQARRFVGLPIRTIYRHVLPQKDFADCMAEFEAFYGGPALDRLDLVKAIPGAADTLNALAGEGHRLYLVTNSAQPLAEAVVKAYGFRCFAAVSGADQFSENKVERCRAILNREGCPPADAAYIGDSLSDVALAGELGVHSVLLDNATSWLNKDPRGPDSPVPDRVLADIRDLITVE